MKLQEFEEMNFKADKTVIGFNSKYANKIMFLDGASPQRVKVVGLRKYLSIDGKKPLSAPFTNRKTLSVSDIYIANSIILMVKFDNLRSEELLPMHTFLEANARLAYNW